MSGAAWQGSRRFSPPPLAKTTESYPLANPELGAKQICPTCSTKFYDLNRRPAHCPKCGSDFDPEEALRNRRVRVRAVAPEEEADEEKPEVVADAETDDVYGVEPEEAKELDAAIDEAPLATDDDAEEADPAAPPPGDALGVDFAEDDELETADDDEVPFIEDEDDAFPDEEIDGLGPEGADDT